MRPVAYELYFRRGGDVLWRKSGVPFTTETAAEMHAHLMRVAGRVVATEVRPVYREPVAYI